MRLCEGPRGRQNSKSEFGTSQKFEAESLDGFHYVSKTQKLTAAKICETKTSFNSLVDSVIAMSSARLEVVIKASPYRGATCPRNHTCESVNLARNWALNPQER